MEVVNKLWYPCQKFRELIQIPPFLIIFTELLKVASKQSSNIKKRVFIKLDIYASS